MSHGQRIIDERSSGNLALGGVNHLRGKFQANLFKPSDKVRHLHLLCEKREWRVRAGANQPMPNTFNVQGNVSDGTGAWPLDSTGKSGPKGLILPAPDAITVKSYNGNAVLTYYWV